jgi:type IV pilus assembly protein PilV
MNACRAIPGGGNARPDRRRTAGFTLTEVLIAATVTIVAFTALATAQMLTLRAADSTLERTQATALTYDMMDRMRLNRGESGLTLTALGGGYDNYVLCDKQSRNTADNRTCNVGSLAALTANNAVTADLAAWWSALAASGLPHWLAGIARTGSVFTVTVQWDDARAESAGEHATGTASSCLGDTMPSTMQQICVMTQL